MALRRLVPRFSLRTLVALLLLSTAAAGLYYRYRLSRAWWPPYMLEGTRRTGPERGQHVITEASFFERHSGKSLDLLEAVRMLRTFEDAEVLLRGDVLMVALPYDARSERIDGTWRPVVLSRDGSIAMYWSLERVDCAFGGATLDDAAGYIQLAFFRRKEARTPMSWPEIWLTAAFAGLFVWSVWRDRRSLRAGGQPTQ